MEFRPLLRHAWLTVMPGPLLRHARLPLTSCPAPTGHLSFQKCNQLHVFAAKVRRCLHRDATINAFFREKCVIACTYYHRYPRQAGGLCGARGLRSALRRSTPSSPPSGSSAERTASRRVPPTHMPWAAIPLGRHTALPPAVKNLTQQGPEFRNGIPALGH